MKRPKVWTTFYLRIVLVELEREGDQIINRFLHGHFVLDSIPGKGQMVPPLTFLLTPQLLVLHATSVLQILKNSLICLCSLLAKFRNQTAMSQSFQMGSLSNSSTEKASGSVGSSIGQTRHEGFIDQPSSMRVVTTAMQYSWGHVGQHFHEASEDDTAVSTPQGILKICAKLNSLRSENALLRQQLKDFEETRNFHDLSIPMKSDDTWSHQVKTYAATILFA